MSFYLNEAAGDIRDIMLPTLEAEHWSQTSTVNRPGFSGGSQPMEDESYGDEVQR